MMRTWLVLAVFIAWGTSYSSASSATVVVANGVVNNDGTGNSDEASGEVEDASHFNNTNSEKGGVGSSNGSRSRRLISKDEDDQWPKGIVPYIFMDDLANWGIYIKKSPSKYEDLRFDMTSHMHYDDTGFSKNGWYTQTVLFRDLQPMLENRGNVYYSWHTLAHAYSCTEEKCPSGAAVTCVNDGFVSYIDNSTCACICPPGLDQATGCSDFIIQVPAPTKWPAGTYAMPSATDGCPGDVFLDGFVQHTSDGGSTQSDIVHVKGEFTPSSYTYHFCVKDNSTSDDADTAEWGPGRYCILKKGDCPTADTSNTTNASGSLPDGVYDADTRFDFCCRDDGFPIVPLKLPNTEPFFLFLHNGEAETCQEVDGMLAFPEFLNFDDDNEGQAAYSPSLLAKKFIYCYYAPAKKDCGGLYALTKENPTLTITSPGYPSLYPNNLDSFWIFTAPQDSTILLNFDDFDIATSSTSECEDELRVRSVLLGENPFTYCGESLHRTIRTVRNTLSLNLRTTPEGERKGFQAQVSLVTRSPAAWTAHDDYHMSFCANVACDNGTIRVRDAGTYLVYSNITFNVTRVSTFTILTHSMQLTRRNMPPKQLLMSKTSFTRTASPQRNSFLAAVLKLEEGDSIGVHIPDQNTDLVEKGGFSNYMGIFKF